MDIWLGRFQLTYLLSLSGKDGSVNLTKEQELQKVRLTILVSGIHFAHAHYNHNYYFSIILFTEAADINSSTKYEYSCTVCDHK